MDAARSGRCRLRRCRRSRGAARRRRSGISARSSREPALIDVVRRTSKGLIRSRPRSRTRAPRPACRRRLTAFAAELPSACSNTSSRATRSDPRRGGRAGFHRRVERTDGNAGSVDPASRRIPARAARRSTGRISGVLRSTICKRCTAGWPGVDGGPADTCCADSGARGRPRDPSIRPSARQCWTCISSRSRRYDCQPASVVSEDRGFVLLRQDPGDRAG